MNNNFIFNFISIFIFSSILNTAIAKEIKIDSYQLGSCWVGKEAGEFKIGLFGANKSFQFNEMVIKEMAQDIMKKFYIEKSEVQMSGQYSVHGKCFGNQILLSFKFPSLDHELISDVCAHIKPVHENVTGVTKLEVIDIYPVPLSQTSQNNKNANFCKGVKAGELIVPLKVSQVNDLAEDCRDHLMKYGTIQQHPNFILLRSQDIYSFQEKFVVREIVNSVCNQVINQNHIEFNWIQLPQGEEFYITEGFI
jgi:hypothetical protein